MNYGVIGAMPSEIAGIKEHMENVQEHKTGSLVFYTGQIGQNTLTLVQCGVGKVNAAITAQMLIDKFNAQAVINTGVAGALGKDVKVLDVVISTEVVHHDADMRLYKKYPPFVDGFYGDPTLVARAAAAFEAMDHGNSHCYLGKIATGDQFIESSAVKADIVARHNPLCVEMEGAAVGHACTANGVPFVIIRTMSDNADEQGGMSFDAMEKVAAKYSSNIVVAMVGGK